MDISIVQSYIAILPTELQEKVSELTSSLPLTATVASTLPDYATITSVMNSARSCQLSAYDALQQVTDSVSSISLFNNIIQAQATFQYYSIMEVAATATDSSVKASLLTQAAEASEVMLHMFNEEAYYSGNYPSLGGNIALLVVYSFFFILQVISSVFYHQWWFLTCWSCAMVLEILGYIGRVWSNQNIMNFNAFVMQLVCLTLAPCFMMAGIYYIIAQLTLIYGEKFSVLRPMQYSLIFIVCDIISIILQAVGGGVAAGALSVYQSTQQGSNIMVGGLAYQVFTIALFQCFWYLFFYRVYKSYKKNGDAEFNPNFAHIRERKTLIPFIITVSFAVILIFVRSIYRLIELAEGWSSKLAVDEIYFMILEGLMVSLATCVISFISPGLAYGRNSHIYIDKRPTTTFGRKKKNNDDVDNDEKILGDDNPIYSDDLDTESADINDDQAYYDTHHE
ncbi:hypothetical protein C6P40_002163 [Pichia californica]|uniref:Sphingoid long-chain base transporter RSB1 n=1 Tax=Pichia californica TaxID=460514 RepID=A0A9P7BEZ3_9ASCO|nr:hypothetical protein C6P42_002175 [[Candida] californica]KAG0687575.1 hypothetical protein C6P40_002163 [[Candida] californica]